MFEASGQLFLLPEVWAATPAGGSFPLRAGPATLCFAGKPESEQRALVGGEGSSFGAGQLQLKRWAGQIFPWWEQGGSSWEWLRLVEGRKDLICAEATNSLYADVSSATCFFYSLGTKGKHT